MKAAITVKPELLLTWQSMVAFLLLLPADNRRLAYNDSNGLNWMISIHHLVSVSEGPTYSSPDRSDPLSTVRKSSL